jgi:hypothetical protein
MTDTEPDWDKVASEAAVEVGRGIALIFMRRRQIQRESLPPWDLSEAFALVHAAGRRRDKARLTTIEGDK